MPRIPVSLSQQKVYKNGSLNPALKVVVCMAITLKYDINKKRHRLQSTTWPGIGHEYFIANKL